MPVSSITFFECGNSTNVLVGTTLGYLVCFHNINGQNGLKYNVVINNNMLEESIIDVIVSDIDFDGFQEIIVIYFNKQIQIYRIKDQRNFEFLTSYFLKELLNFPFCAALIMNNFTPVLYLFATNMYYKYSIILNGKKSNIEDLNTSFIEILD